MERREGTHWWRTFLRDVRARGGVKRIYRYVLRGVRMEDDIVSGHARPFAQIRALKETLDVLNGLSICASCGHEIVDLSTHACAQKQCMRCRHFEYVDFSVDEDGQE